MVHYWKWSVSSNIWDAHFHLRMMTGQQCNQNLSKARKQWARIAHVLSRTGASPRTSSMFYKAVVQSVLLYGSETWTLSATMLKVLRGFHNRVARKLSGFMAHPDLSGSDVGLPTNRRSVGESPPATYHALY